MAHIEVTLVDDQELPEGTDWVLVFGALGERCVIVKRSRCKQECGTCPVQAAAQRLLEAREAAA